MDTSRYRAGVTPSRASLPAVILLAALALAAGCGDDEPAATPSPTPRAVALGELCEQVGAAAVDQGQTMTCVYHGGKATWQTPTPAPPTPSAAPIVGGRCDTAGATAVTAAGTRVECSPDGPGRLSWSDPAPPTPKPKPTIEQGIWTVGVDIPPGTYRVTAPVEEGCYWAITKSGTNGDDIIANDLVSGGRPTVTVRKGQDFETNDCGTWEKVK